MTIAPQTAHSQELLPIMTEFKTLCLATREAIADLNRQGVIDCRNKIDAFYSKEDFSVEDLSGLEPADSGQADLPRSECKTIFDVEYLDSLLIHDLDLAETQADEHNMNRGGSGEALYLTYKAIPAKATMSYTFSGCCLMNLVVVAAQRKDINLTLSYEGQSYQIASDDAVGVKARAWNLPDDATPVTLTIENPNRIAVTCVIATN